MNLSGIIFHIEEDAYEKLNKYLATIRSYFRDSDGRDEIMSDIESRIAEMLQEKVNKNRQAVLLTDVESVIAQMGRPEDFAAGQETQSDTGTTGGSEPHHSGSRRRRLFRDPDEKILSGVCSGIAHYFDFDPIWLRAAFAISFFVFGSGFLVYLILWIIMPEARTTAEKLEMRGEKVDINNIGKAVNEEFEGLKKRVRDFGNEIGSRENTERIRTSAQRGADFIGDLFRSFFQVFAKVMAVFFVIIGIALMVGLLATLFGKGSISVLNSADSIHFSLYEFCSAVMPAGVPVELIVTGLVLFIGVPLLSIIYRGIRYLFGIREKNRIVTYTANILWLCGLAVMIYIGCMIAGDFKDEASTRQPVAIQQPAGNLLYLDVKPTDEDDLDMTFHRYHRHFNIGDWAVMSKDENSFRIGYPTMSIIASESGSFELTVIKSANGSDKKDAAYRAHNIDYTITQKDSLLSFNSYYNINAEDKLRGQDVKIILKMPVNKVIYLSRRMEKIIYNIENISNTYDGDMVNRRWIMTQQGLRCLDCLGLDHVQPETDDSLAIPPPPQPVMPVVPAPGKKKPVGV